MPQPVWNEINLGPALLRVDGGLVGSQIAFSLQVKYADPDNPGEYLPFDLVPGYTFEALIKRDAPGETAVPLPITVPGALGDSYIDVLLTATDTEDLGKGKFFGTIEMWPTGDQDVSTMIAQIIFNIAKPVTS